MLKRAIVITLLFTAIGWSRESRLSPEHQELVKQRWRYDPRYDTALTEVIEEYLKFRDVPPWEYGVCKFNYTPSVIVNEWPTMVPGVTWQSYKRTKTTFDHKRRGACPSKELRLLLGDARFQWEIMGAWKTVDVFGKEIPIFAKCTIGRFLLERGERLYTLESLGKWAIWGAPHTLTKFGDLWTYRSKSGEAYALLPLKGDADQLAGKLDWFVNPLTIDDWDIGEEIIEEIEIEEVLDPALVNIPALNLAISIYPEWFNGEFSPWEDDIMVRVPEWKFGYSFLWWQDEATIPVDYVELSHDDYSYVMVRAPELFGAFVSQGDLAWFLRLGLFKSTSGEVFALLPIGYEPSKEKPLNDTPLYIGRSGAGRAPAQAAPEKW